MLSTESVVVAWANGWSVHRDRILLMNDSCLPTGCDSVCNGTEGDSEEDPVNDGKRERRVDGVAFPRMVVTTVRSNAPLVFADVDGDGDPNCKEHSPVDEFEDEGDVMMRNWTMNHAGGQDPCERENCPGPLKVSKVWRKGRTAATVKRTSFHASNLERV